MRHRATTVDDDTMLRFHRFAPALLAVLAACASGAPAMIWSTTATVLAPSGDAPGQRLVRYGSDGFDTIAASAAS